MTPVSSSCQLLEVFQSAPRCKIHLKWPVEHIGYHWIGVDISICRFDSCEAAWITNVLRCNKACLQVQFKTCENKRQSERQHLHKIRVVSRVRCKILLAVLLFSVKTTHRVVYQHQTFQLPASLAQTDSPSHLPHKHLTKHVQHGKHPEYSTKLLVPATNTSTDQDHRTGRQPLRRHALLCRLPINHTGHPSDFLTQHDYQTCYAHLFVPKPNYILHPRHPPNLPCRGQQQYHQQRSRCLRSWYRRLPYKPLLQVSISIHSLQDSTTDISP